MPGSTSGKQFTTLLQLRLHLNRREKELSRLHVLDEKGSPNRHFASPTAERGSHYQEKSCFVGSERSFVRGDSHSVPPSFDDWSSLGGEVGGALAADPRAKAGPPTTLSSKPTRKEKIELMMPQSYQT
jgi:hypothetical protein